MDYWDIEYYFVKKEEDHYKEHEEDVKKYFPLETVIKGMFEIFQTLLNVNISRHPNNQIGKCGVKVKYGDLYEVQNKESQEVVGYFYLDLFTRNEKLPGARTRSVQSRSRINNLLPISVLEMNLIKINIKTLLTHGNVVTLFHEFGHVMHLMHLEGKPENLEWDLIELPSTLFENWAWEKETLRKISGHYKHGKPIPENLLERIIGSRYSNQGYRYLARIVYSIFDQRIHSMGNANTAQVYACAYKEVIGIHMNKNANPAARFHHIKEYGASHYCYLMSEVCSTDMYQSRFKKEGIFNPKVGKEFKAVVLENAGGKPANCLIKDFLGRKHNTRAFLTLRDIQL